MPLNRSMMSASTQCADVRVIFEARTRLPLELPLGEPPAPQVRVGSLDGPASPRSGIPTVWSITCSTVTTSLPWRRTRACTRRPGAARRANRRRSATTLPMPRSASCTRRCSNRVSLVASPNVSNATSSPLCPTASWHDGSHPLSTSVRAVSNSSSSVLIRVPFPRRRAARWHMRTRPVEDLGHTRRRERLQPGPQVGRGSGPRERGQEIAVQQGPVAIGHPQQMVFVHREMPLRFRYFLDARPPFRSAGETLYRRGITFVHRVEHHGERGARSRERTIRARALAVVEHGSEHQRRAPAERRLTAADRHHTVADSRATSIPFGPLAATMIGVAIGRLGAMPSACSICTSSPSTSTWSPRNNARTCSM